jgi:hypothetical protein
MKAAASPQVGLCHIQECVLKEYARAEGVSAKLGVASELAADLSCENRVPETVEYCKKVPCNSVRPHVDAVLGGNGRHVPDEC